MLDVAPNPYSEPLQKIITDLKATKWKLPFILPIVHAAISIFLIFVLLILYITLGFVSQVSNSFWRVVAGQGQKMSFSAPLSSFYYAISATVFFIIFLPFFVIQSPFWMSGWLASKIGFKLFITLIILTISVAALFYFQPEMVDSAIDKVSGAANKLMSEFFPSDTLNVQIDQTSILNPTETNQ
ncbi:MAG: hypothetical protein R3250_05015 [Melioribacteraceae bacterium]|nr:hypothetical protein [Melioribacteraceae bacterium]